MTPIKEFIKIMFLKRKSVLTIVGSIFVICLSIFLYASDAGRMWQMKWLGTFQPTSATMINDFSVEGQSGKTSASAPVSYQLYFTGHYTVGTKNYTEKVLYKNFYAYAEPSPGDYIDILTKEFVNTGNEIQIFYNPNRPSEAVTFPEDQPHYFFLIFIIIIIACALIIIIIKISEFAPEKSNISTENKDHVRD